jgi:6-phosphogluconolactonase
VGQHLRVALTGEVSIVDDIAAAFSETVVALAPRSLALSGGTTARRCYERLAVAPVEWSAVECFFGDERWVPTSDPDSNEGMARVAFVDQAQPAAVHPMYRPDRTIEQAAAEYDALVRAHPPIDLVHLGVGPDGHTASLFPGTDALDERDRLVVANGDDEHPYPRLTFTFPAIARSPHVVFTVAGEGKRDVFARLRAGEDLPAARVRAGAVHWLVDRAAAG